MIQAGMFWAVLAASATAWWLLPARVRPGMLALVSAAFLAWFAPMSALPLLGFSLLFYWVAPLAAPKRKMASLSRKPEGASLVVAGGAARSGGVTAVASPPWFRGRGIDADGRRWVVLVLSGVILIYLACFKYFAPLFRTYMEPQQARLLLLPLGISYFTFKLIHYGIEVGRGNIKPHSLQQFLCYIFVFPAYSAGPIERFDHFLANREDRWRPELIGEGLMRIIHGLIKKFIFADVFLFPYFQNTNLPAAALAGQRPLTLWGWMIASYLYVYMDFSGYMDVALGACRLYGLRLMENFDFPVLAPNIGVFWKRWHMTLAGWCQSYIYMPVLGWSRNPYVAVYATFIVMGLWHGATLNWILWGIYNASGIVIYQRWSQLKRQRKWKGSNRWHWKAVAIALTFLFVSAGELFTLERLELNYDFLRIAAKLVFIPLPASRVIGG